VIAQNPPPGATVPRGRSIDLAVAVPPEQKSSSTTTTIPFRPTYLMPNLVARTPEEAMADAQVQRIGLQVAVRGDPAASGKPGLIVRQSVAPGTVVEPGSPVVVWVATGVVVPDLVGQNVEAARTRLAASGLDARVREVVRDRGAGQVVDQSPGAGTVVARAAAVEIGVAVIEMATVPNVVRQDRSNATNLLTAQRLTSVFINDQESDGPPGLVIEQAPPPGTSVPIGSAVRMRVALGVVVPSVVGLAIADAESRLASTGLKADTREVRTDQSRPNAVFQQTPPAGQRVARGTNVVLSVALATLVAVPDLGERPRDEAIRLLTGVRLRGDFTDDTASGLEPGLVAGQDPAPGAQVESGTVVRLRLATGVVVPSFVGASGDDAQARATAGGFASSITEVRTEAAASGTVFQQTPAAGQRVARGSPLQLSVARPSLVTVPSLLQYTRPDAESAARSARLKIAFEDDRDSTFPPDRVSRQDPAPGASVEVGAILRVGVATGVSVPDVVNLPVDTARSRAEAAGLKVDEQREVSTSRPESTVLRQSPDASAVVARGSVVRLVVAALETVSVPDVVGRTRSQVAQMLASVRLVAVFEEDATAATGVVADTVVRQDPLAGATVAAGSRLVVVLARQQPPPPPPPDPDYWQRILQWLRTSDVTSFAPLLLGAGLAGLVVYRIVRENFWPREPAAHHEPPPAATSVVQLDPHVDDMTARLEVSGSGLIDLEVRIRLGADSGEQSLGVEGRLLGEERRLYE
jgi:beta-lactam-binding protein with PASTA domain